MSVNSEVKAENSDAASPGSNSNLRTDKMGADTVRTPSLLLPDLSSTELKRMAVKLFGWVCRNCTMTNPVLPITESMREYIEAVHLYLRIQSKIAKLKKLYEFRLHEWNNNRILYESYVARLLTNEEDPVYSMLDPNMPSDIPTANPGPAPLPPNTLLLEERLPKIPPIPKIASLVHQICEHCQAPYIRPSVSANATAADLLPLQLSSLEDRSCVSSPLALSGVVGAEYELVFGGTDLSHLTPGSPEYMRMFPHASAHAPCEFCDIPEALCSCPYTGHNILRVPTVNMDILAATMRDNVFVEAQDYLAYANYDLDDHESQHSSNDTSRLSVLLGESTDKQDSDNSLHDGDVDTPTELTSAESGVLSTMAPLSLQDTRESSAISASLFTSGNHGDAALPMDIKRISKAANTKEEGDVDENASGTVSHAFPTMSELVLQQLHQMGISESFLESVLTAPPHACACRQRSLQALEDGNSGTVHTPSCSGVHDDHPQTESFLLAHHAALQAANPTGEALNFTVVRTMAHHVRNNLPDQHTWARGFGSYAPIVGIVYDERMLSHEEVQKMPGLDGPLFATAAVGATPTTTPLETPQGADTSATPSASAVVPHPLTTPGPGGLLLPRKIPAPHPERPDRLRAIAQHLVATGLFQRSRRIPARVVTRDELRLVHRDAMLHSMEMLPSMVAASPDGMFRIDGCDTYANHATLFAAKLSAGSVLAVTESVLKGRADRGVALVRPPGHHAEPDRAMGFCIFNNVALAASAAVKLWGAKRVLILDWDVHAGNGTETAFYDDPSVLLISLHRHEGGDFYPGTGHVHKVGEGSGKGYNINIAWPEAGYGDMEYMAAFDEIVMPVANAYNPDLVLVSAGFDAARGDPLGGNDITPAGYAHMMHRLLSLARGRCVVVLEGGYNLTSISNSMEAVLRVLHGESPPPLVVLPARTHDKRAEVSVPPEELGLTQEQAQAYLAMGLDRVPITAGASSNGTSRFGRMHDPNGMDHDTEGDNDEADSSDDTANENISGSYRNLEDGDDNVADDEGCSSARLHKLTFRAAPTYATDKSPNASMIDPSPWLRKIFPDDVIDEELHILARNAEIEEAHVNAPEDEGGWGFLESDSRNDILEEVAPKPGALATIAHVLYTHAPYWPALRCKFQAYRNLYKELRKRAALRYGAPMHLSKSHGDMFDNARDYFHEVRDTVSPTDIGHSSDVSDASNTPTSNEDDASSSSLMESSILEGMEFVPAEKFDPELRSTPVGAEPNVDDSSVPATVSIKGGETAKYVSPRYPTPRTTGDTPSTSPEIESSSPRNVPILTPAQERKGEESGSIKRPRAPVTSVLVQSVKRQK